MRSFVSSGTKIEGILRQSADVEEVERRVQEYEQGTNNLCQLVSLQLSFKHTLSYLYNMFLDFPGTNVYLFFPVHLQTIRRQNGVRFR